MLDVIKGQWLQSTYTFGGWVILNLNIQICKLYAVICVGRSLTLSGFESPILAMNIGGEGDRRALVVPVLVDTFRLTALTLTRSHPMGEGTAIG